MLWNKRHYPEAKILEVEADPKEAKRRLSGDVSKFLQCGGKIVGLPISVLHRNVSVVEDRLCEAEEVISFLPAQVSL